MQSSTKSCLEEEKKTLYFCFVCLRVLSIPLWLFSFMKIESDMALVTI